MWAVRWLHISHPAQKAAVKANKKKDIFDMHNGFGQLRPWQAST